MIFKVFFGCRVSVVGCGFSGVGFRFSRLLCLNLVVDYYRCYLSILERSVFFSVVGCRFPGVGCGLWVFGFHGYCA
jgi:hypothetical protein